MGDDIESKSRTLYLAAELHRWDGCKLIGLPDRTFGGANDGSIGFVPAFDNFDKLKAAYPDAEITYCVRGEK